MNNIIIAIGLIIIMLMPVYLLGQQGLMNSGQSDEILEQLIKSQLEKEFKKREAESSSFLGNSELISSINVDEYIVDAGDEFSIKINVKGPEYKIYNLTVTPAGYIIIPDGPSLNIRYKKLEDAKRYIKKSVKNWFPETDVDVYLNRIHPVQVSVIGTVPMPGKVSLLSNHRLFDVIMASLDKSEDQDEYKLYFDRISSFRKLKLIRKDTVKEFDLFKFHYLNDFSQNPYIMDQDVVYVPHRDTTYFIISVTGAISKESLIEFNYGDCLANAIRFAGGFLQSADTNNIELYRFKKNSLNPDKIVLSMPKDSSFILLPDDRILVRNKYKYHQEYEVLISGEVKHPGTYVIEDGITTLTSVIAEAGGFTDRASLKNAKIIRNFKVEPDKELQRLRGMSIGEMDDLEKSYFRLRSRENNQIVTCNFERLFIEDKEDENVLLMHNDEIIIPKMSNVIYVSGGVILPGNVNYKEGLNYLDYINLAGGYNTRAKKGDVQIIKAVTGVWMDAEKDIHIGEGDIVFIPEEEYFDWYRFFRESLSITTQIATVVLIIVNLQNVTK